MKIFIACFFIVLMSALYLAAVQFRASVHASAESFDANGNVAIALRA
jgi:hypothetical protein